MAHRRSFKLPEAVRKDLPDSIVIVDEDGTVYVRSSAIIYAMKRLGGFWRVIATVASLVPVRLSDVAYDLVARIRHRLFPKPTDACPLLPLGMRNRFLP